MNTSSDKKKVELEASSCSLTQEGKFQHSASKSRQMTIITITIILYEFVSNLHVGASNFIENLSYYKKKTYCRNGCPSVWKLTCFFFAYETGESD